MKTLRFFSGRGSGHLTVKEDGGALLIVAGAKGAEPEIGIWLNPVQVDKLRQQFHEWLHERANGENGLNWMEIREKEPHGL